MIHIKIKQIIQETSDARTFVFDVPPYSWDYQAGQYITLTLMLDNQRLYRSYSLASSPYHDPLPAITIKKIHNGKVSNYLHDHINIGSELICSPPRGDFIIDYTPHKARQHIFIAAGSGIVPLFSMIKSLLHQEPHSKASLIYINRNQNAIIYKQHLYNLQRRYQNRINITHILTQPNAGWQGIQGRLTAQQLRTMIQGNIDSAHYWLCAPQSLMDLIYSTLFLAGISPQNIHQETFTSPPTLDQEDLCTNASVTIHHRGETKTIALQSNEKILDALLDANFDIPFSCCSGICNTCRVKCTSGSVHMLDDEGLSQEEKEQGYILTCVSYPKTKQITLDLDE